MKARTLLWYLVFAGFAVNYMIRINIGIAIISMVRPSQVKHNSNNTKIEQCYNSAGLLSRQDNVSSAKSLEHLFDWDEYQQTQTIGGFFWLHWVTEVPGGILAHHYGTKHVFGLSNFIPVLLSFGIPAASYIDYKILIALRVIQGFFAGAAWPSMHNMLAKWVPPNERSRFTSAYLGSSIGVAVTYFISGFIIDYFGWEYVFYVTGGIGTIWYVCWTLFVYESPDKHPWISNEERAFILASIGNTFNKNKLPVPWKQILLSGPVWLTILAQWGTVVALFTLLTHAPTYLKAIHGLDIKLTGALSALPQMTRWMFSFTFAMFADYLVRKNITTTTNVRKIAASLCTVVSSALILWLAFTGCNTTMAVIAMVIAITLQGAVSSGPIASLLDLSPNFSGILLGISGMVITTAAFCSPLVVGLLTEHNQTVSQWQKVFFISASVLFTTGSIYLCFGTSELQDWNSGKLKKHKETLPIQRIVIKPKIEKTQIRVA